LRVLRRSWFADQPDTRGSEIYKSANQKPDVSENREVINAMAIQEVGYFPFSLRDKSTDRNGSRQ
jgi:hypothetical protein